MQHALALFLCLLGGLSAEVDGPLFVVGGHLFDGIRDDLRPNAGILIVGGRVLAVDRAPTDLERRNARILKVKEGATILPGLFDLHAHYAVDLFRKGRVDERVANPLIFLANGVTTTFPAGEVDPEEMRDLRIAIDRGETIGPRILSSGPYFGRWRRGWDDSLTPAALAREVDHWAELGVRGFKAKGIRREHLAVLIERAHAHGLTVTGHLDSGYRNTVNPLDAIGMGIDRVEHFLGGATLSPDRPAYDAWVDVDVRSTEFKDIAHAYVSHGVYFDATMSAYGYFGERDPVVYERYVDEPAFLTPFARREVEKRPKRKPLELFERIYWKKRATIKAFYDAGGGHLITAGTDHPSWGEYFAGFGIHRELHCLALSGIPPADVLRTATINAARAMGVGDLLGTLEPGKLGDLIVVDGDPLADIRSTRRVLYVVKAGVRFDADALLAKARGRIGPANADELDDWCPRR